MNALHMISEIPLSREAIARFRAFAALKRASERFFAMTVHSMSFSLVTEKTGG